MSKYSELLKDFNWIAVRNKVIVRDGNKCTVCGSRKNLNVHHTFYYSDNRPPWLYSLSSLLTVCEPCHYDYHLHHEIEIRKAKPIKLKQVKKKTANYFRCECVTGKRSIFRIVKASNRNDAIMKLARYGYFVMDAKKYKRT